MNTTTQLRFAGFDYDVTTLSAYISGMGIFVISLKNSTELLRYEPDDPVAFCQWLEANGVRNVNATLGKMVYGHYFLGAGKGLNG